MNRLRSFYLFEKSSANQAKRFSIIKFQHFLFGAGEANADALLNTLANPDDIIPFFRNPVSSRPEEFRRLYEEGLSLREIKIVRKVMALSTSGKSFNAIVAILNSQKVPSKLGNRWSDKTIASIVRRHKKEM